MMANPESLIDLISDKIFQRAIKEPIANENIIERFKPILRGFEEFNLSLEKVIFYKYEFEAVLNDFMMCFNCDGNCRTSAYLPGGTNMYNTLNYTSMKFYNDGRPVFTISECPGINERKRQIKEQLTAGKIFVPKSAPVTNQKDIPNRIAQCKDILNKSKVIEFGNYQNRNKYHAKHEEEE
jgi:hypothetical protein